MYKRQVDDNGRLLCGGALGVTADVLERAEALLANGVDVMVLDSAHGHSENIANTLKKIKGAFPHALSLIHIYNKNYHCSAYSVGTGGRPYNSYE